jgi:hypothetical protein
MPPQQRHRLLDLVDDCLRFGAHLCCGPTWETGRDIIRQSDRVNGGGKRRLGRDAI